MYGDLLLDQLGVNFLGPAPLDPELLHMLSTFHWNAFGQHSWVVVLPEQHAPPPPRRQRSRNGAPLSQAPSHRPPDTPDEWPRRRRPFGRADEVGP